MPSFSRKPTEPLAATVAGARPALLDNASAASRLAAVQASIAALNQERGSHREALALFPERERALLERDAPDDDLMRLDVQKRRSQHAIARLNEREQLLLRTQAGVELEVRQVAYGEALDGYEAIAADVADLATRLRERLQALGAASNHISGVAREWQIDVHLPGNAQGINWEALAAPMEAVQAARRMPVSPPVDRILHAVRFVRFWDSVGGSGLAGAGYPAGVEAGFPVDQAWQLVDDGFAAWPDPTRIPARPAAREGVSA